MPRTNKSKKQDNEETSAKINSSNNFDFDCLGPDIANEIKTQFPSIIHTQYASLQQKGGLGISCHGMLNKDHYYREWCMYAFVLSNIKNCRVVFFDRERECEGFVDVCLSEKVSYYEWREWDAAAEPKSATGKDYSFLEKGNIKAIPDDFDVLYVNFPYMMRETGEPKANVLNHIYKNNTIMSDKTRPIWVLSKADADYFFKKGFSYLAWNEKWIDAIWTGKENNVRFYLTDYKYHYGGNRSAKLNYLFQNAECMTLLSLDPEEHEYLEKPKGFSFGLGNIAYCYGATDMIVFPEKKDTPYLAKIMDSCSIRRQIREQVSMSKVAN